MIFINNIYNINRLKLIKFNNYKSPFLPKFSQIVLHPITIHMQLI
jgi:hypothetical protein